MIVTVEYEANGIPTPHDGTGTIDNIELDLSSMNIPQGYPLSGYTIALNTERNFHEFSSYNYAVVIVSVITDDDAGVKTETNSYYANFIEI